MRPPVLVAALTLTGFFCQGVANEELVGSWYPILQEGNTWVYADESRDADTDHGIDDPTIGRWTTTETVSTIERIPEGTRVTIRSRITDLVKLKGWIDNSALMMPSETQLLVRRQCIYRLQAATYCFPMRVGGEWGRMPSKEDEYDIWRVKTLNGDRFGVPGERTFHVSGRQGSGDTTDYWFQQGVGIAQFVEEHHGTYDQHRRMLKSTTFNGVTRTFDLQPARTPPLEPGECRDGWRHWVRADGSILSSLDQCMAYARTRTQNPEPRT